MTIYGRLSVPIITTILLSACGGDEVHDTSPQERMMREAMCVAASERFALYDDAKNISLTGWMQLRTISGRLANPRIFRK